MGADDFELLTMIGKGAFGEVCFNAIFFLESMYFVLLVMSKKNIHLPIWPIFMFKIFI